MNTLSRVQLIQPRQLSRPDPSSWRAVRILVEEGGTEMPQVTLSPGDHLLVENRTPSRLHVAPLDFFGNAFVRFALEPGKSTSPMVVRGLWFQVELRTAQGRVFPLDVYLAPNRLE